MSLVEEQGGKVKANSAGKFSGLDNWIIGPKKKLCLIELDRAEQSIFKVFLEHCSDLLWSSREAIDGFLSGIFFSNPEVLPK